MKGTLIFAFLASIYSGITVGSSVLSKRLEDDFFEEGDRFICNGREYTSEDVKELANEAYGISNDGWHYPDSPLKIYNDSQGRYPNHEEPFCTYAMLKDGIHFINPQTTDYILLDQYFNVVDVLTSQLESCEHESA